MQVEQILVYGLYEKDFHLQQCKVHLPQPHFLGHILQIRQGKDHISNDNSILNWRADEGKNLKCSHPFN